MGHQQTKQLSDVEQAVYYHSRERRRSLAGIPEMFRSLFVSIPTTPFLAEQYPTVNSPVTLRTAIQITGPAPAGLIFEVGDATTALALWVDGTTISLRAGDAGAADLTLAEFDNTVTLPLGLELDIVAAIRPGDGRSRMWFNGTERARGTATNGQLLNGTAANSNGAFAAAAVGPLPADVTQTGAPVDFAVIEPLSLYYDQVPRHFV